MVDMTTANKENIKKWKPINFWQYSIKKYRVSKMIRELIEKDDGYDYSSLGNRLGVSRQYIYNVMMMNLKPNQDFISRLKELENE